jgi:hypothetical protein
MIAAIDGGAWYGFACLVVLVLAIAIGILIEERSS